jgi:hypothetical protein
MVEIIKLIQEAKIPAWAILIIIILGWIIMQMLINKLKVKAQKDVTKYESQLNSLQINFERKLKTIEEVEQVVWEFNHEFEFLMVGSGNLQNFTEYYYKARKLGRNSIGVIGKEGEKFSDIIRQLTDIGKGLVDSNFEITEESIGRLEQEPRVPDEIKNILRKKVGQSPSKLSDLLKEIDKPWLYSEFFFWAVEPTSGIKLQDYFDKKDEFLGFNKKRRCELPSVNDN